MLFKVSKNVNNFMSTFKNSLPKGEFSVFESKSNSIPPASLHSFLMTEPTFPGVVLTGFSEQFKNKYVYSFFNCI